jgi:hypothetical protein
LVDDSGVGGKRAEGRDKACLVFTVDAKDKKNYNMNIKQINNDKKTNTQRIQRRALPPGSNKGYKIFT